MTYEEALELLGGPIEPTPEEAKNGWTKRSLTVYHAELEAAIYDRIINPPKKKPTATEHKLKWPRR